MQTKDAISINIHPKFYRNGLPNDVAIIRLKEPGIDITCKRKIFIGLICKITHDAVAWQTFIFTKKKLMKNYFIKLWL
jgi:hypothetical protein